MYCFNLKNKNLQKWMCLVYKFQSLISFVILVIFPVSSLNEMFIFKEKETHGAVQMMKL